MATDLGAAEAALARRDPGAAEAAFRRAFEAADATAEQRARALDGLVAAAIEGGRAGALAADLEQRRAAAPRDQQAALLAALVRTCKARDGHFHAILPALEKDTQTAAPAARRLLQEVQAGTAQMERSVKRLGAELALAAEQQAREAARPKGLSRLTRPAAVPGVGQPSRPDYAVQAQAYAPPPRQRLRVPAELPRVPLPQVPRARLDAPQAVTKPPAWPRPTSARLAAAFFTQAYQKATELAGEGLVESAKAEYATLMQLFPDTPQAQQAARYALGLFQRERILAQGGDPLGAYLQWIRAVLGPKGSDYAEHLGFRSLAGDADPAVLAREAEEFVKRYPDSKYGPGVRLQLAVALDRTGATPRAIEVLQPLVSPIDDEPRVRAARILAWLYLFQGEAAAARGVLEALAAQTTDPDAAAEARRTLAALAANPLPKLTIAEVVGAGDPDEVFSARLLDLADQCLQRNDGERAVDLYELYLRVARESQGFRAVRDRIQRIKRTGRADEE
ncbi:MAG TPA: hypothetical protein PLE19_10675 [Planctomycetota bacterium]|nr:hypothetical protein [Planctomycetota bacterium]HRR79046.1 hypothetical protein [Planctomycetota bacterium]HRT97209.1 hypothetical protein [Planctomycetota bacterium]